MKSKEPNSIDSSRSASFLIGVISLFILSFLFWWIYAKPTGEAQGVWIGFLPYLNCFLNTSTAILLLFGYWSIKRGKRENHKKLMISALLTSVLFLISYLVYHHFQGDTSFSGVGFVRVFYFIILIGHILFSMIQIPFILSTFWFAYKKDWTRHRKAAKVTFPIWLFVSVTGVLVFILLKIFNK